MRNSEFFKSTNTNSQTRCNPEEQQYSENCTFQLVPIAPKEEATETLNWNTFSMRRLTHLNSPFLAHSSAASRKVRSPHQSPLRDMGIPSIAPLWTQKDLASFDLEPRHPSQTTERTTILPPPDDPGEKKTLLGNRTLRKKRLACALARRFTLSQNGYGTKMPLEVTSSKVV